MRDLACGISEVEAHTFCIYPRQRLQTLPCLGLTWQIELCVRMKKTTLSLILLLCGILNVNGQNWLNKALDKHFDKLNAPRNYIYKENGDFYLKKKNGKEKKVSEIGHGGIDTLFIEDPSIPVGQACISPVLSRGGFFHHIKVIMANDAAYLETSNIREKLVVDNLSQGIASYRGVQGFQAQEPNNYGSYSLELKIGSYGDKKDVSQLNLPDAIIIDGESGELRGYFSGAKIEKIVFSPKIRKIGKGAFRYCGWLQEVVFPEGCDNVEIDPEAFADCKSLKTIRVPNGKGQEYINMGLSEALIVDGSAALNMRIELQKPGTILDKIPLKELNKISSLSVTGFLDENDIEVLKECVNLKKLDLFNAYTTISEELQKQRKANSAFLRGMIQAMGELSQKKYENGEISTVDNLQVQLFTDLVKGTSNVKKASVGCVIPTGSFSGMKYLETVVLPVRASVIESKAFQNCPNLKEVMLPPYLKEIGTGAFAFCRNLKSVVFPKTLTTIGMYDRQHTYGKSAAASFVETGIEKIDFNNCAFESNAMDDSWSYRFHCKNLKVVMLPNIKKIDVGFGSDSPVICYVPSSVEELSISGVKEIHFSSPTPPSMRELSNCVIYVPKGCLTQYYAKFNGNGNTLNEE